MNVCVGGEQPGQGGRGHSWSERKSVHVRIRHRHVCGAVGLSTGRLVILERGGGEREKEREGGRYLYVGRER